MCIDRFSVKSYAEPNLDPPIIKGLLSLPISVNISNYIKTDKKVFFNIKCSTVIRQVYPFYIWIILINVYIQFVL